VSGLPLALLLAAQSVAAPSPSRPPTEPGSEKTVFNGATPSAADLRHAVRIVYNNGKEDMSCTGVLISANVAATAAHCWDETFLPRAVVLLGAAGQERPVVDGARHEHYDESADPEDVVHDVGYVVFGGRLPEGASPAELLVDAEAVKVGDPLIIVGTGFVEPGAERGPRRAVMNVFAKGRDKLAAQARGTGVCNGDSGGPAFIERGGKLVVAALTAAGAATRCRRAGEAVFTYIPPYRSWLLSAARAAQGVALPGQAPSAGGF
jgi:hypothetical protein